MVNQASHSTQSAHQSTAQNNQSVGQLPTTSKKTPAADNAATKPWRLQAKRDEREGKSYVLWQGSGQPQLNVFTSANPTQPQTLNGEAALRQFRQAVDGNTPVSVAIKNPDAWHQKTVLPVNAQGPVEPHKTTADKPVSTTQPEPNNKQSANNDLLAAAGVAGVALIALAVRKPQLAKTLRLTPQAAKTASQVENLAETAQTGSLVNKAAKLAETVSTPRLPSQSISQKLSQKLIAADQLTPGSITPAAKAQKLTEQMDASALKTPTQVLDVQTLQFSTPQKIQQAFDATDFTPTELNQLGNQIRQIQSTKSPGGHALPTPGLARDNGSALAHNTRPLNHHITQVMTKLGIDVKGWTPAQVDQAQDIIAKALAGRQTSPAALNAARTALNGTPHQAVFDRVAQKLSGQYDEPTRQRILTQLAQQLPKMTPGQLKQLDAAIAYNPMAGLAAPKNFLPEAGTKAHQALDKLPHPDQMQPKQWRDLLNGAVPKHHAQVLPAAKGRLSVVNQRLARLDDLLADAKLNPARRAAHQLEKRAFETEQRHMQKLNNTVHNGIAWLKDKFKNPSGLIPRGKLKAQPPATSTPPAQAGDALIASRFSGSQNGSKAVLPKVTHKAAKITPSTGNSQLSQAGGLLTQSYTAQSNSSALRQAVLQLPEADQQALGQSLKSLLSVAPGSKGVITGSGKDVLNASAGNLLANRGLSTYDDQMAQLVDNLMPGHLDNLRQQGADIAPVLAKAKQHVAKHLTQKQLAHGQQALNAARQQLSQSQPPETVALTQQVLDRVKATYANNPAFAQQASQQLLNRVNNGTIQPDTLKQLLAASSIPAKGSGLKSAETLTQSLNQSPIKLLTPTQQALKALPPGSTAPQSALPHLPLKQMGISADELQAVVNHPKPEQFAKLWQRANKRLQTLQGRATQLETLVNQPGNPLRAIHQQELKLIETEMRRIQDGSNALWQIIAPLMMSVM